MAHRDIIVIGASAGGVEALPRFFQGLKERLPAAFFVVMHMPSNTKSLMPALIQRAGRLPTEHATDLEPIQNGRVYIAPPDHHLLLEADRVRLSHGPKENRHRPAIDPLFRTAATNHGARVIGILLTGTLDDGSVGLKEIKRCKGMTIVQDPTEALHPEMPLNALALSRPDFCLKLSEMGSMLPSLLTKVRENGRSRKCGSDKGTKPENRSSKKMTELEHNLGPPSGFICPECNGPLWQIQEKDALHYRCMVGHAYSPENFLAAQSEEVEKALWVCLRALEQRVALQQKLAERSRKMKQPFSAESFIEKANKNARHARIIRQMLERL